ncbi:hypothetical protein POSPLADRAFT_1068052 [Postia placenta MAD-698-R-SB12]|uniref:NADP-dependent oxidoreductase domain-containing protein n=1 Tax=Postia placenta MAD-698-R-SB12 TaxID=670580 RepID=A0A1X6MK04_9APHY|nr:hypothetical protein POSPLADRAFT_1068052 [Postia placenta MAD-698-R-SB12]OSX56619.1 hypothetical protein POSPLADRAFT_1068052 [Postia placenta MAD-698-R-SB12]
MSSSTTIRLGKSGLKVSRIILGCMTYGGGNWAGQNWLPDEEEAVKHIKYAYDAGIQTFDTANMYSNGGSEEVLGRAIKQLNLPREEIVVMTKPQGALQPVSSVDKKIDQRNEKHIFDTVKASLKRLQLDYIDVLQVHRYREDYPMEELMEALHDVVKAGYVRYIGMSGCYAWQYYAINNRLTPFISMQDRHSLVYREEEREMFPTLEHFGVSSIPYHSLARGILCRPFSQQAATKRGEDAAKRSAKFLEANPHVETIVNRVEEIAKKRDVSMAQVAIAWELSKSVVAAPVVGTTKLENIKDIIEGVFLKLSEEETKYLEEPYRPMDLMI